MVEKKETPLISIVIPLYNKELWIGRCIDSILAQTYQKFEILVVNDGSTDNSKNIVAAIKDPRIVLYNKVNGGVSSARNLGLRKACGEYVALIDADDAWGTRHLEMLLGGFELYPQAVLVCDDLVEISGSLEQVLGKRNLPHYMNKSTKGEYKYFKIDDYLKTLEENYFILSGSSVLIRTSTIKISQLKFEETITHGEDINYWLHLNLIGDFIFCDYLGLKYYRTDQSSAMNQAYKTAKLVPPFFKGIDLNRYSIQETKSIHRFLRREYFKKAYQNRGLPLGKEELSTNVGGGMQIARWYTCIYLVVRYAPLWVFSLRKKL